MTTKLIPHVIKMHSNVHYAIGLFIASVTAIFLSLNVFEYAFIVFCSTIPDLDFIFKKFARDGNHRNFITHTVYPSIIMIVVGILVDIFYFGTILNIIYFHQVIWIGGIAYLSHIMIDFIDWGLNPFFTNHHFGFYLLITQHEKNLAHPRTVIDRERKKDQWFFVKRYYSTRTVLLLDTIISIAGFLSVFAFTPQFWYFPIGMFLLLEYHLYQKKKAEEGGPSR